jgi:hypothetical protein
MFFRIIFQELEDLAGLALRLLAVSRIFYYEVGVRPLFAERHLAPDPGHGLVMGKAVPFHEAF